MNQVRLQVTLFVTTLYLISCSGGGIGGGEEHISFGLESQKTFQLEKIESGTATIVMAYDDTFSMAAKVEELTSKLEKMFLGLVTSGWEIDLHVVTCAHFKDTAVMRSASTSEVSSPTAFDQKVRVLMDKAAPTIDLATKDGDGDERCNQSLAKAWNNIAPKNKVNLSLLISDEDGCSRDDSNLELPLPPPLTGTKKNCAPVTFGRMKSAVGGQDALLTGDLDLWEKATTKYTQSTWLSFYNGTLKAKLHPEDTYINFFNELETESKKTVPFFTHIYLPIVVDTQRCLAQSMQTMALREQDSFAPTPTQPNFIPLNTVGNIGYSYLRTFDGLDQDTKFKQSEGDLSICSDLSQVVDKLEREIRIRGENVKIKLPRPMDEDAMRALRAGKTVLRIVREVNATYTESFFTAKNIALASQGLSWKKLNATEYVIDLPLESSILSYDAGEVSLAIANSDLLTVTTGDRVVRAEYIPVGFRDGSDTLILNGG